MFSKRETNYKKKEKITSMKDFFYAGMERPYLTYPEHELLADACKSVAVFANVDERIGFAARSIAIGNAGSCIASLKESEIKEKITSILLRCCNLDLTETIVLTNEEKQFIKACIEGDFYKPFYEI